MTTPRAIMPNDIKVVFRLSCLSNSSSSCSSVLFSVSVSSMLVIAGKDPHTKKRTKNKRMLFDKTDFMPLSVSSQRTNYKPFSDLKTTNNPPEPPERSIATICAFRGLLGGRRNMNSLFTHTGAGSRSVSSGKHEKNACPVVLNILYY